MADEQPALQGLAKQAEQLTEQLALARLELTEMQVTGSADGGLVTVTMTGDGQVTKVVFDQAAVDEGDAELLAAFTLTAIRRATDTIKSLVADRMAALTASFPAAFSAHAKDRAGW